MLPWSNRLTEGLIGLALLMPLVGYGAFVMRRPPREPVTQQPLFQGITYSRQIKNQPRPQVIHIVDIDLSAEGLRPFVSPGLKNGRPNIGSPAPTEALAQRTSDFLHTHQLQLAINANYFYPFWENAPWDYGPQVGAPSNLIGIAISNAQRVSAAERHRPSLCFLSQQAEINDKGQCPKGTQQAISGKALLLQKGRAPTGKFALSDSDMTKPYPVNIAAVDATGTRLWLVLSDGKQPLYSEGTTLLEATDLLRSLGADTALQLDGGGSTTLAVATDASPVLLNAVIHSKIPGYERPVGNQLGFFANPLPTSHAPIFSYFFP